MPRTEFHSKLERQIQAIESVAKETQGVAAAIEDRAGLAGLVIRLATGVQGALTFDQDKNCNNITRGDLSGDAQVAHDQLGFTSEQLKALCVLICPPKTLEAATRRDIKTTPPPEPKSPPPTSPPRGKVAAKNR